MSWTGILAADEAEPVHVALQLVEPQPRWSAAQLHEAQEEGPRRVDDALRKAALLALKDALRRVKHGPKVLRTVDAAMCWSPAFLWTCTR